MRLRCVHRSRCGTTPGRVRVTFVGVPRQLGFKDVPLKALDAVALVFPFLWFCAAGRLRILFFFVCRERKAVPCFGDALKMSVLFFFDLE